MPTSTKPNELTPAQVRVLIALGVAIEKYGAPSLEEWGSIAGQDGSRITNASIIQHRKELERKGMITVTPGKTRSVRLSASGKRAIRKAAK